MTQTWIAPHWAWLWKCIVFPMPYRMGWSHQVLGFLDAYTNLFHGQWKTHHLSHTKSIIFSCSILHMYLDYVFAFLIKSLITCEILKVRKCSVRWFCLVLLLFACFWRSTFWWGFIWLHKWLWIVLLSLLNNSNGWWELVSWVWLFLQQI